MVSSIRNIAISNDAGSRSKAASPFQDYAKEALIFTESSEVGMKRSLREIKNVFMSILRDIKKEIDSGEQPGETVIDTMF